MSHLFYLSVLFLNSEGEFFFSFFVYIKHNFLALSHTLVFCSFKIATTAASTDSSGILGPLINFTAGGKALCWEIFFAWHTRRFDLLRAARGLSWRSRGSGAEWGGHRPASAFAGYLSLPPLIVHTPSWEQGDSHPSRSRWEQRAGKSELSARHVSELSARPKLKVYTGSLKHGLPGGLIKGSDRGSGVRPRVCISNTLAAAVAAAALEQPWEPLLFSIPLVPFLPLEYLLTREFFSFVSLEAHCFTHPHLPSRCQPTLMGGGQWTERHMVK